MRSEGLHRAHTEIEAVDADAPPALADPRVVSGSACNGRRWFTPSSSSAARARGYGCGRQRVYRHPQRVRPDHVRSFPDFVTEAVRAQLEKGVEIGPQSPLAARSPS